MLYWETADQDPSLDDSRLGWARLWKPFEKVVFSRTLWAVEGAARLASGGLAEEIERLRAEPREGTSRSAARRSRGPSPDARLGMRRVRMREKQRSRSLAARGLVTWVVRPIRP